MVIQVRKCDRCGREIPKNATYQGVSMFRLENDNFVESPMYEWDLCPTCSLGLSRYIRGYKR